MKVFLDTNVLVSALATRGLCADVLREVVISHQLFISAPLLAELESVLQNKLKLPKELITGFIEWMKESAHLCPASPLHKLAIKDQDDLPILSSALNGGAEIFVTGDHELLALRTIGNMSIVPPRGFWKRIRDQERNSG